MLINSIFKYLLMINFILLNKYLCILKVKITNLLKIISYFKSIVNISNVLLCKNMAVVTGHINFK